MAEALPFPDDSFDVVMAILTVHHWDDLDTGLAELCRVAPRRVVLSFDQRYARSAWMWDYFAGADAVEESRAAAIPYLRERLGGARVEVVPIPHDCADGFAGAYWRRPEAYLDPVARAGISSLAVLDPAEVERAVDRLRADLESGEWHDRNADLLELDEIDLGYRLIVS